MYNKTRFHHAPVHFANLLEGLMNPESSFTDYKAKQGASVNIRETADQYELHLLAPGLNKEDFKIDVDKNLLTIAFEHKEESKETDEKWLRQEFKMSSFKRSFSLNEKIDAAAIKATYENGILNVSLPKKEKEEAKAVSIAVQ
ncbi:MAG: Hsp20/alpha crystallin family protein [Bacteroidota bacterium]